MQKIFILSNALIIAMGLTACGQEPVVEQTEEAVVEEVAAPDPAVLKEVDRAAAMMAMELGSGASDLAYYLPDGIQLDDGKENIDNGLQEIMADHETLPEGLSITWTPHGAGIADSGELGYTWGRWSNFTPGEDGEIVETFGKYVTIWKKQEDGSWKIAIDIWNSEDPQE